MEHEKKEVEPQVFSEEEPITSSQAKSSEEKKKRGHPWRWIFLILLLAVGVVYIQQTLVAWDSEAMLYAQQTASYMPSQTQETPSLLEKAIQGTTATVTAIPSTATFAPTNPSFVHTQTIAVQLTDVARFQLTQGAPED
ncbi:MAG TPA: hypothetical protein DCK95_01220 [Anaerolineaceae bacterium]|nr:hypothetical protein [Anaerolineaceae bacterium]